MKNFGIRYVTPTDFRIVTAWYRDEAERAKRLARMYAAAVIGIHLVQR